MAFNVKNVKGAMSGLNQMATPPGANGPAGPSYTRHSHGHIAPSNPNIGDLWSDAGSGQLFVYMSNGWVVAGGNMTTGGNVAASISSAGSLSIGNQNQSMAQQQSYSFHKTQIGRAHV